jgi:hypothetical protein
MVAPDAVQGLVDGIWRAITARADKVTGRQIERPPMLGQDGAREATRYGAAFPVLRHLDHAIDLCQPADLGDLARAFGELAPALRWSQNSSYTEQTCSRSFLDGYAYAGLSGPEGPIVCAAPRNDLMLMGPGVHYPAHHHAPREFYLVMTPGSQWRLDGGAWFDVAAGDLILHEPWQMHEMRTFDHPMLAIAGWTEAGDRNSIAWDQAR